MTEGEVADRYKHAVDGLKHSHFFVIEKDHKGKKVEIRESEPKARGVVRHKIAVCRKAHLPAWFEGYLYGSGGLSANRQLERDGDVINRLQSINLSLMEAKGSGFVIVSEVATIAGEVIHAASVAKISNMQEIEAWLHGCEYGNKRFSKESNTTTEIKS